MYKNDIDIDKLTPSLTSVFGPLAVCAFSTAGIDTRARIFKRVKKTYVEYRLRHDYCYSWKDRRDYIEANEKILGFGPNVKET